MIVLIKTDDDCLLNMDEILDDYAKKTRLYWKIK